MKEAAQQTTLNDDLLYQVALTLVPNIGPVQAKVLIENFGDAASIFKASVKQLGAVENMGEIRARNIKNFNDFGVAEEEIKFIEKFAIQPLFMTSGNYPKRLLNSYDAPVYKLARTQPGSCNVLLWR